MKIQSRQNMNESGKKTSYTTGQFASKAHVTVRTIRFYDQKGLLTPSCRTESGARLYTESDFARLQQILLFKYLGFTLDEIRELTVASGDPSSLLDSLNIQKKLISEKIDEMRSVESAIDRTTSAIRKSSHIDWQGMMDLIHLTSMEQSMQSQYTSSANISARIRLHRDYSVNPEGWFRWIYRTAGIEDIGKNSSQPQILELGCGSGSLWAENIEHLPDRTTIILSDISKGMLKDARLAVNRSYQKNIEALSTPRQFHYKKINCEKIPLPDNSCDCVIGDHLLFYLSRPDGIKNALTEIRRVLKEDGIFIASTYGRDHMKEITKLVHDFNPEITLSQYNLYDRFGLENGEEILSYYFDSVDTFLYPDHIEISEAEPLIAYILSCHGNQNSLLLNHYREFRDFIRKKVKIGIHITKSAGIFIARK